MSAASEEPLRILRVLPFFEPATGFGGSVSHAAAISERLAAWGHRVRVLTTDHGVDQSVPRNQWVPYRGYEVFHARTTGRHRVPPYLPPRAAQAELATAVREHDVVTSNVGLTLFGDRVRRVAHAAGVPYVYNAEGALCPERLRIKRLQKLVFVRLVERRVLRGAAALQAVTEKEAADYAALGGAQDRIHVIPNGVAVAEPVPDGAAEAFRDRLGIDADARLVLFLGRLHAIKGVDLLLSALLPRLQSSGDAHLVIAGPDEGCRAELERVASEASVSARVHFTGNLEAEDRAAALAAADLFALTSHTEGLPLAVLEAAAAGLPLLVSEGCNIPEVAAAGAGVVVKTEVLEIRQALDELLGDPAALARCRENARRMATQTFSLDGVARRLEALYRSVVK